MSPGRAPRAWATATSLSVEISFRPRSTSERWAGDRPASPAISCSVRLAASRRPRSTAPRSRRTSNAVSLTANVICSRQIYAGGTKPWIVATIEGSGAWKCWKVATIGGCRSVLEVRRVEQVLALALDLLTRAHDLDQLLATLRRADHDRADQPVVLEEELAVELLVEAERADRLEPRLHVGRDARHGESRAEHRGRVGRNVEEVLVRTGHVSRRQLSVRLRVVPRAHLVRPLDHEVVEHRDIAGRIHVGRRRAQLGVGHDSFLDLHARVRQRLGVVVETDAVGQEVELHLPAADRLSDVAPVAAAE